MARQRGRASPSGRAYYVATMAQFPPPGPPPLVDWPALVRRFSEIGVQWFREEFTATLRRNRSDPEVIDAPSVRVIATATTPPERRVGCPSCDAHTATIAAWGRVQSIVLAAEASGGKIPPALPSTLYLARADLNDARGYLREVEQRVPSMRERVWGCMTALDVADRSLPDPSTVTVDACREASPSLEAAVREVTMMSNEYEGKLKVAQGNERLRELARQYGVDDPDGFYEAFHREMTGG